MKHANYKASRFRDYVISCTLVFLATLFGELVKARIEPTNIIMFYLLIVVFSAIRWGIGPAIATSIISVLAFDFFLVPPYLTLSVTDVQYLFTFAAFLTVGIALSTFASRVREQVIQHQTEKLHSALLSSISHDLKTPLASTTGALTALLDKGSKLDDQHKRELLETAREGSDRLNRLVNNLLDMTKMEADVLRIRKKPCDLRDLIGACLEQLKDKIGLREIRIKIPKDFPEIAIDFPVMLKALFNIIDNGLKYSPESSPIEITAACFQHKATIEIRDYGRGITGDNIKHIFEKFYRVERSQDDPGTGLGLCISRGIVEAHGGRIDVESAPGKGSAFTIELPME